MNQIISALYMKIKKAEELIAYEINYFEAEKMVTLFVTHYIQSRYIEKCILLFLGKTVELILRDYFFDFRNLFQLHQKIVLILIFGFYKLVENCSNTRYPSADS